MLIASECIGGAIKPVQPSVFRADPKYSGAILKDRQHSIVTHTVRILRIIPVTQQRLAIKPM